MPSLDGSKCKQCCLRLGHFILFTNNFKEWVNFFNDPLRYKLCNSTFSWKFSPPSVKVVSPLIRGVLLKRVRGGLSSGLVNLIKRPRFKEHCYDCSDCLFNRQNHDITFSYQQTTERSLLGDLWYPISISYSASASEEASLVSEEGVETQIGLRRKEIWLKNILKCKKEIN